ncbi:MAG: ATP-binding protein [Syntrophobacterales bacterium]
MVSRLTLSNRPENLKALREFLRDWGKQRGLSRNRLKRLEKAASDIFHFIIKRVYRPEVPGSLTIILEDKGVRLRLVFEDDGPPYDAPTLDAISPNAHSSPDHNLSRLQEWSDSLVYYRTADQKNRLVTFYTL